MNTKNNLPFIARFTPFLMAGLTIVLFIAGIIIFSWIFLTAAFIGLILFIITTIKAKFTKKQQAQEQGRIIEYDEKN